MQKGNAELIVLWLMPALAVMWIVAYRMFPGFSPALSPTMSAEAVAAFYRDPSNAAAIKRSMLLLNWCCVGLILFLSLILAQVQRMAHRTPIWFYATIGCVVGGPTMLLIADLFWLLAAFRPERAAGLIQMYNDIAWVSYSAQAGFLVGQCVFLAIAIYLDRQAKPVFKAWVAHFNLLIAAALAPSTFAATSLSGPWAPDGLLSFWVRNLAALTWFLVMLCVIGVKLHSRPAQVVPSGPDQRVPARSEALFAKIAWHWRYDQKIDLWLAWLCMVIFYTLFGVIFVLMTHVIPPPSPAWSTAEILRWFAEHRAGLLSGFGLTFLITGMAALSNSLIAYSLFRMTVSRAYPIAYIILYSLSAIPGLLFCAILFSVAALRPERDFDLILWLYDGAMLTFVGTMGIFLLGTLVWLIAVLTDKNRVLPPWFGYLNICNLLTEVVVAPAWTARRGAFCWSGSIAFWVDVGIFAIYTAAFILVLRRMVEREDLGSGPLPAEPTSVTLPAQAEVFERLGAASPSPNL